MSTDVENMCESPKNMHDSNLLGDLTGLSLKDHKRDSGINLSSSSSDDEKTVVDDGKILTKSSGGNVVRMRELYEPLCDPHTEHFYMSVQESKEVPLRWMRNLNMEDISLGDREFPFEIIWIKNKSSFYCKHIENCAKSKCKGIKQSRNGVRKVCPHRNACKNHHLIRYRYQHYDEMEGRKRTEVIDVKDDAHLKELSKKHGKISIPIRSSMKIVGHVSLMFPTGPSLTDANNLIPLFAHPFYMSSKLKNVTFLDGMETIDLNKEKYKRRRSLTMKDLEDIRPGIWHRTGKDGMVLAPFIMKTGDDGETLEKILEILSEHIVMRWSQSMKKKMCTIRFVPYKNNRTYLLKWKEMHS